MPALALFAAARAWLGDHAGAFADAGEAAELGDQLGYAADAAVAVEMLAWQSAARGLHDDARVALSRAKSLTDRAGTTGFAAHQALTAAFCALCRADPAAAVSLLEARIAADGGVGSMGEPFGVAPYLVEAYLAVGRRDEAIAAAERFATVTPAAAPPWLRALVARCRGLTADETRPPYRRSRRLSLAHAEALRHLRDRPDAVCSTAPGCAAAVNASRRASSCAPLTTPSRRWISPPGCNGPPRNSPPPGPSRVPASSSRPSRSPPRRPGSPCTRRKGMANKEIAAALFLSPKTVEHHLSSVYRKRQFPLPRRARPVVPPPRRRLTQALIEAAAGEFPCRSPLRRPQPARPFEAPLVLWRHLNQRGRGVSSTSPAQMQQLLREPIADTFTCGRSTSAGSPNSPTSPSR